MVDAQPNVHRRRLGLELRALRKEAGLNLDDAASKLGLSGAPALSKIENGKQRVAPIAIAGFLEAYNCTDPARSAEIRSLATLASSGKRTSLLARYRDSVRDPFAEYVHLEELAKRAETFVYLLPGLLQTEEYAQAVVTGSRKWSTQRDIRKFVELRMKRQQALTRSEPLGLWCVLDEAALRREVGGPDVMRRQLQRLVEVSEELPHVAIQVLPFAKGAHAGMDGGFTLLHFEAGPPVAVVEPMTTSLYLEDDRDVGRYETGFNHLRAEALDTEQSLAFIRNMIKDS
ncbi:helix-turn-helix domain-containing protein [Streptantibioticus ferralitis]|uniref:Helix-turn-helix transcriptional regulator n=1 Tax=Streptantibioticus ferralitis TaxID=236510 RepID=A0ABT5Z018_9ACTN|nr:helix-turn-helix transcriptional regulator [Streptantibioticus ferralitis]MDF2257201.1 helix-turn-helix transcriptional regulator [Streptantibioticus ferralitis]